MLNIVALRKIVISKYNTVSLGIISDSLVNNIIKPLEESLEKSIQM